MEGNQQDTDFQIATLPMSVSYTHLDVYKRQDDDHSTAKHLIDDATSQSFALYGIKCS